MKLKKSFFLGVLALTMVTQLRSVYSMMGEDLETSQSLPLSIGPKSVVAFEEYFKKVLRYGVVPFWDEEHVNFPYDITDEKKNRCENYLAVSQKLIELAPSLAHFNNTDEDSGLTYIEVLFKENLGLMAEKICTKLTEANDDLPEKYNILLAIYRGKNPETDFVTYSTDFINVAYKVANNARNIDMVSQLYPLSGVAEVAKTLKQSNPLIYCDYIHEPYWSYNLTQLQEYGGRIIEKIKPHFVKNDRVKKIERERYFCDFEEVFKVREETYICENKRAIKVREVPFGYVLPNIYLKERLMHEKDYAVPRIFIVPKNDKVKFRFRMPYTDHFGMVEKVFKCDCTAENAMQVLSEGFVVYQEWIDGSGQRGNRDFAPWGHRDFNQVQIIRSNTDGKSYLVDTKEEKNFFAPYFSPFVDDYTLLEKNIKASCITDNNTYKAWKKDAQTVVYDAKNLHFDRRVIFVDVTIPLSH
ncbi:MAG: hypothetical protein ACD_16C00027G0006 [uncultured bacterium]|nr:MAG: hypothetical protein ACD_16C00027G0006 [uncultured bacterium]OFX06759.1 MAG: hypothetical protein A3H46_03280 [Alphaproteobacteria bacterium RIFCSPLOWO2_02_FULL_43_54]OFX08875.1 MAG: hypothetical protein A3G78_07945 [Alphaproteobacteria bacterium RIFCSPLOWO2_12_FULL_42_29]HCE95320.1 hypothetical protein [Holosporales bacterium]